MNLDELKGKTLDEATHGKLIEFVSDLTSQRDAARRESIDHRKGLKTKVEELESSQKRLLEKLGVDAVEDLESLPDAKGQAEALKQHEAKIRRLERERQEAIGERDALRTERAKDRRSAAVAKVVAKHQFIDPEVATLLIEQGVHAEGDDFLFKAEGGRLVPLDEGAAFIAKTKPHLVKAQGGTGSGYRPNGGSDQGAPRTMKRAEFEALPPEARSEAMRAGTTLTD